MQEHWLHISLSSGAHGGRAVSVDWGVWGLQVTVTSSALDHSINIQRRHLVLCDDKTLWRVFYPPISALSPIFTSLSFEGITLQSPKLRFCLFIIIIFFLWKRTFGLCSTVGIHCIKRHRGWLQRAVATRYHLCVIFCAQRLRGCRSWDLHNNVWSTWWSWLFL